MILAYQAIVVVLLMSFSRGFHIYIGRKLPSHFVEPSWWRSKRFHSTKKNHQHNTTTSVCEKTSITPSGFFTCNHYPTLTSISMCGAHIEIVQAPRLIETILPQYQPDKLGEVLVEELQSVGQSNGSMHHLSEFIGGRVALRRCFSYYCDDISWDEAMQPMIRKPGPVSLPKGWIGSISHKNHIAVAALRQAEGRDDQIGIDIEQIAYSGTREHRLKERISTKLELEKQPSIDGLNEIETALLRFSMKESVFKAIYPSLKRYVGYQEVEIFPSLEGTAEVKFKLSKDSLEYQGYKAEWTKYDDKFFITTFYLCKDI